MRWLDPAPRRARPKGHETFILRAASTSSHRLLQRRLLSAHTAQNTADLRADSPFLSAGRMRFGGCDDGDRGRGLLAERAGAVLTGAFEFPVGHLALDDAGVGAGAAFEQVA